MASPLNKIIQLITDKIGFTYVATFQFRSEVVILNCTEKKLLKKQRMNKTPRCRTGVPNLGYAYHWWYAERSQVVRRKKAELIFVLKNLHSLLKILVFDNNCLLCQHMGGFNLLEILGVIGAYSLPSPYLQLVVRKIVFCSFGGTRLKKGWEPLV